MAEKTRPMFTDREMQTAFDSLITRVTGLEAILDDFERFERSTKRDKIKASLKGHLNNEDYDHMRTKQEEIALLKRRHGAYREIEKDYILQILNKVVPVSEVTGMVEETGRILTRMEEETIRFIEAELIPIMFIDSHGEPLEKRVVHTYEVRCEYENKRQKGHVSEFSQAVSEAVMDAEFFRQVREGDVEYACKARRCTNPTFFISTANVYTPINPLQSALAVEIGARMKSGGRLVNKFIDRLAGITGKRKRQISDESALRIVGADERTIDTIYDRLRQYTSSLGTQLTGRVRIYGLPRNDFSYSNPKHTGIHIDWDFIRQGRHGKIHQQVFELQIQDSLGVQQDKYIGDLTHTRYVEKQQMTRRERWRPIHHALQEHLMQVFEGMDYLTGRVH